MDSDYIALLKKVLTGYIYPESANAPIVARDGYAPYSLIQRNVLRLVAKLGLQLQQVRRFDAEVRELGRDWPSVGYTMVGLKRLNNVQWAFETVLAERIPGDLCECGVWRGGCAMFMRALLKEHRSEDRLVWAADSFEGLPRPNAIKYPADRGLDYSQNQYLSVPLHLVQDNFRRFNLLDDRVRFLKGWFKDTLPAAPIKQLALLRADGDLYESTMDTLTALYERVSPGGFVIVDDYGTWETCRKAVDHFRTERGIQSEIHDIDGSGVFWRKTGSALSAQR